MDGRVRRDRACPWTDLPPSQATSYERLAESVKVRVEVVVVVKCSARVEGEEVASNTVSTPVRDANAAWRDV